MLKVSKYTLETSKLPLEVIVGGNLLGAVRILKYVDHNIIDKKNTYQTLLQKTTKPQNPP